MANENLMPERETNIRMELAKLILERERTNDVRIKALLQIKIKKIKRWLGDEK